MTPKGADYHKPRWPKASAPDAEEKLNRKLRDRQKAAKRRAARLADMTPEELARHEAWQKTHKPGPPGPRAVARRQRRENASLAASMAEAAPPPSDEAKRLLERIERLKELRDGLASESAQSIFD